MGWDVLLTSEGLRSPSPSMSITSRGKARSTIARILDVSGSMTQWETVPAMVGKTTHTPRKIMKSVKMREPVLLGERSP